jgi:hypothetical protein
MTGGLVAHTPFGPPNLSGSFPPSVSLLSILARSAAKIGQPIKSRTNAAISSAAVSNAK